MIVMEFLEGGDLFSLVINRSKNQQPVNEQFLAPAFRSAMESLRSIHNRKYLHRDLKLDNMVLTSTADDAVVKIIDCGYFCHAPEGVVQVTGLVGSPGYFAPESLQTTTGFREYSTKSDVWQAGCALYIMLSGKCSAAAAGVEGESGQVRTGLVRSGLVRSGQVWSGQVRSGQDRVGDG